MNLSISAVVLTLNEEKNLSRCLESLHGWVEKIFIVDSGSSDKTLEIAKRYTEDIRHHPFTNHSRQFNWAIDNLSVTTEWIMRLDADETVSSGLRRELEENLPGLPDDVIGLYVKRKVFFMGRWIKHGGYYPTWLLRIWRKGKGRCEDRWMDEHVGLDNGKTLYLKNDIIDDNKKDLGWWIMKHNNYADREAIDLMHPKLSGMPEERNRWFKNEIYVKIPLFLRAFLYFFYRYFIRLGFMDGREGLIFHFLQGFWYRFLVDAKIYEARKRV